MDVRAVALLDALAGDARADHLRQAVGVGGAHPETTVDLGPHRLRPRLGADGRVAQADLVGPDAPFLERLRQREGVARRAGDHFGPEVGDQRQLPLGHPARGGHDGHPEPLRAVVVAESSGEQPVAERVVEDHPGLRAEHGQAARVDLCEERDVGARVADDGGFAGRPRRTMDAYDLLPRHGEEAERVVIAQVRLARERQPAEVVEGADLIRLDAGFVEALAVEPDAVVDVGGEGAQAVALQLSELIFRERLRRGVVEHRRGPSSHIGQRTDVLATAWIIRASDSSGLFSKPKT